MTLASVSMAQQPTVPADPFLSCFLTYMLDTKYRHGTTGCPAGPGPCGHINSAACTNLDCSTYMLATRYEHVTAGCPAGPGPLWPYHQRCLCEFRSCGRLCTPCGTLLTSSWVWFCCDIAVCTLQRLQQADANALQCNAKPTYIQHTTFNQQLATLNKSYAQADLHAHLPDTITCDLWRQKLIVP